MTDTARLRDFIQSFTRLVEDARGDEERIFADGKALLAALVSRDDWLPEAFARPHPDRYQQYLLYCDPLERFSIVSFVWGPGQTTPVHDHTVWGMIGVLRGTETCEEFAMAPAGGRLVSTGTHALERGSIDFVSPRVGDIHRVSNALPDRPSISIHVYGANIGAVRRHVYEAESGAVKEFISGYSSDVTPNIRDRSAV